MTVSSWINHKLLPYLVILLLLPCIYLLFGWYTAENMPVWSEGIKAITDKMEIPLTLADIMFIGYCLVVGLILFINLSLTVMTKPMEAIFSSWLRSDIRALLSVLGWSLGVVVIVRWIHYFLRVLLILCATILATLELQQKGLRYWRIFLILSLISFGNFALGIWLFLKFHHPLEFFFKIFHNL
jgi:hypothetical protein